MIDACLPHRAKIDLPPQGGAARVSPSEHRIGAKGLGISRIQLGAKLVDGIIDWICTHPWLIFLVAMQDEDTAQILVEDAIPKRGRRLRVPLVLIEDR